MGKRAELWGLLVFEAVVWYAFAYYLLFAIKSGTNIWTDALVLLILGYIGFLACPWVHETKVWKALR